MALLPWLLLLSIFHLAHASEVWFPSAEYLMTSTETSPCFPLLLTFSIFSDLSIDSPPSLGVLLEFPSSFEIGSIQKLRYALSPDQPRQLTPELEFFGPQTPEVYSDKQLHLQLEIENNRNVFVLFELESCSSMVEWISMQMTASQRSLLDGTSLSFISARKQVYVKKTKELSLATLSSLENTREISISISKPLLQAGSGDESIIGVVLPLFEDFDSIEIGIYLLSNAFSVAQCRTTHARECTEILSNILWEISFGEEELQKLKENGVNGVPLELSVVLDRNMDQDLSFGIIVFQAKTKTLLKSYLVEDLVARKPMTISLNGIVAGPGWNLLNKTDGMSNQKGLFYQPKSFNEENPKTYLNKIKIEFEINDPYFIELSDFPLSLEVQLFESAFSLPLGYIQTSFSKGSDLLFQVVEKSLVVSGIPFGSLENDQSEHFVEFMLLLAEYPEDSESYFGKLTLLNDNGVVLANSTRYSTTLNLRGIEKTTLFASSSQNMNEHDSLTGISEVHPRESLPLVTGEEQSIAVRSTFGLDSELYPDYSGAIKSSTEITFSLFAPDIFTFSPSTKSIWTYSDGSMDSSYFSLLTSPSRVIKEGLSIVSISVFSSSLSSLLPWGFSSYQKIIFTPVDIGSTESASDSFGVFDALVEVSLSSGITALFPENIVVLSKDSSDLQISILNFQFGQNDPYNQLPVFIYLKLNRNILAAQEIQVFYAGIERMGSFESDANGLSLSEKGNLFVSSYFNRTSRGDSIVFPSKPSSDYSTKTTSFAYIGLGSIDAHWRSEIKPIRITKPNAPTSIEEIEQKLPELVGFVTYPLEIITIEGQTNYIGTMVSVKLKVEPDPYSDGALGFYVCGEWSIVDESSSLEIYSDDGASDEISKELTLVPECSPPSTFLNGTEETTCLVCHFTNGELLTEKLVYKLNRFQLPRSNGLRWPSVFYGGTFNSNGVAGTYTNIGEKTSTIMEEGDIKIMKLEFGREITNTTLWASLNVSFISTNKLEAGNSIVIEYPSTITVISYVEVNENCFINDREICSFTQDTNRFEVLLLEDVGSNSVFLTIKGFRVQSDNVTVSLMVETYSSFSLGRILDSTKQKQSVSISTLTQNSDSGGEPITLELLEIVSRKASSQTSFVIRVQKPLPVFQPADSLVMEFSGVVFSSFSFCTVQSYSDAFIDGIDQGDYFASPNVNCEISTEDSQATITNIYKLNTTEIILSFLNLMVSEALEISIQASLVKWGEEEVLQGSLAIQVAESSLLCEDFILETIENVYSEPQKLTVYCTIQVLFQPMDKLSIYLNPMYFSSDPEFLVVLVSEEESSERTLLYTDFLADDIYQAVLMDLTPKGTSLKFEILNIQEIAPISIADAEENLIELHLSPYSSEMTYFSYRLDSKEVSEASFGSSSLLNWTFSCTNQDTLAETDTLIVNFSYPEAAGLQVGDSFKFEVHFGEIFSIYQQGMEPTVAFSGVQLADDESQDQVSFVCETSPLVVAFQVSCVLEQGSVSQNGWLVAQWILLQSEVLMLSPQNSKPFLYLDIIEASNTRFSSQNLLASVSSPFFKWSSEDIPQVRPGLYSKLSYDLATPNISSGFYFEIMDSRIASLFLNSKKASQEDNSLSIASSSSLVLWVSGNQVFPECLLKVALLLRNSYDSSIEILVTPLKSIHFLPEKIQIPFKMTHFGFPYEIDVYSFSLDLLPFKYFSENLSALPEVSSQSFKNYTSTVDFSVLTSGCLKFKMIFISPYYNDIESRFNYEYNALITYDFLKQYNDISLFDLWYEFEEDPSEFTVEITFDEFSPFEPLNITGLIQSEKSSKTFELPVFDLVQLTETSVVYRITSTAEYITYMGLIQKVQASFTSDELSYSDSGDSSTTRTVTPSTQSDGIIIEIIEIYQNDESIEEIYEIDPEELHEFLEGSSFESNSTFQSALVLSNPDSEELYVWFENLCAGSVYLLQFFYISSHSEFNGEWKQVTKIHTTNEFKGQSYQLSFHIVEDYAYSAQEEEFVCLLAHFIDFPNIISYTGVECSEEVEESLFKNKNLVPGVYTPSSSVSSAYRDLEQKQRRQLQDEMASDDESEFESFYMKYEIDLDVILIRREEAWEEHLGPERVIGIISKPEVLKGFNQFLRDNNANYEITNMTYASISTWTSPEVSSDPTITIDRTFLNVENIFVYSAGLFKVHVLQNGEYEISSALELFDPEPGIKSKIVYSYTKQVEADEELSFTVPNLISSQEYKLFYYARGNDPRSDEMVFSSVIQVSISTEQYVELYSLIFERFGSYLGLSCFLLASFGVWLL